MSNVQSIIVYRNPIEAAFWESGLAFPVIAGTVVGVAVALALNFLFTAYNRRRRVPVPWGNAITQVQSNLLVAGSILATVVTIWFLI